ncbi:MAG: hypothetical protein JST87_05525 [Bacteroidetes bacterium]|nr:hypothetical protein [Bacteroidota bacterium]
MATFLIILFLTACILWLRRVIKFWAPKKKHDEVLITPYQKLKTNEPEYIEFEEEKKPEIHVHNTINILVVKQ